MKGKTRKPLSLAICLVMVMTAFCSVPAVASAAQPEDVYQASKYFDETSNPKDEESPWRWQYYNAKEDAPGGNPVGIYDLKYTKPGALNDETAWTNHECANTGAGVYNWANCSVYVTATVSQADTSNDGNVIYEDGKIGTETLKETDSLEKDGIATGRDYPIRTFTAPRDGIVKISADGALQAVCTHVRIRKFSQDGGGEVQLWPADGWKNIQGSYPFEDFSVSVKKGDRLTFENAYKYIASRANTAHETKLTWDPVVTYSGPDENEFKSSEYYLANLYENGPWSNWFYNVKSNDNGRRESVGYVRMQYTKSANFWAKESSDPGETIDVQVNHPTSSNNNGADTGYAWGDNGVVIGRELMRADIHVDVDDGEKSLDGTEVYRDYPVRTFTAPRDGVVEITAEGAEGRQDIQPLKNDIRARILRISQDGKTTQVWPAWSNQWQRIPAEGMKFDPIQVAVKEGDKLNFECTLLYTDKTSGGGNYLNSEVKWSPVVTYDAKDFALGEISFEKDGVSQTDFAGICGQAGNITAKVELACYDEETGIASAVALVGIYNKDGVMTAVGLSGPKPVKGGVETFEVTVRNEQALEKGSIKVFVFDSLTGLKPLSNIGASAYIMGI